MSPTEASTAATDLRSLMAALHEDLNEASITAPASYFKYPIRLNTPIPTITTSEQRQEASMREADKIEALGVATVVRLARPTPSTSKATKTTPTTKGPRLLTRKRCRNLDPSNSPP